MSKKPTVTIGVPALNEEHNIGALVDTLTHQQQKNIIIEKILVLSDGSTDQTVERAQANQDKRVQVIDEPERKGKPTRMNQMFDLCESDYLVMLDADVEVSEAQTTEKLVEPMMINDNVDLTAGFAKPLSRKTFAEQIAFVALDIWDEARSKTKNSDMYYCGGQIRGFRKRLYKQLKFPSVSADDVYAYLFCKKIGRDFQYVASTGIFYKLPATISDFITQNKRFLRSQKIQTMNFGRNFIVPYYTIGLKVKMHILLSYMSRHFFWTTAYLGFVVLLRVLSILDTEGTEATWHIITSTKKWK